MLFALLIDGQIRQWEGRYDELESYLEELRSKVTVAVLFDAETPEAYSRKLKLEEDRNRMDTM